MDDEYRQYVNKTPLYCACEANDLKEVERLLDAEGNANEIFVYQIREDLSMYEYALSYTISKGYNDVSKCLIRRGASLEDSHFDTQHRLLRGPFTTACIYGNIEMIQHLVSIGAVNKKAIYMICAFCRTNRLEIVQYLFENGFKADFEDEKLYSINRAAEMDDVELVELLCKYGCRLDTLDRVGDYPIHSSMRLFLTEEFRVLQFLLDKGIDPNCKNLQGETPLHCAAEMSKQKALSLLLERGASVDITDIEGHTPLYKAVNPSIFIPRTERDACIEMLLEAGATPCLPIGPELDFGLKDLEHFSNVITNARACYLSRVSPLRHRFAVCLENAGLRYLVAMAVRKYFSEAERLQLRSEFAMPYECFDYVDEIPEKIMVLAKKQAEDEMNRC